MKLRKPFLDDPAASMNASRTSFNYDYYNPFEGPSHDRRPSHWLSKVLWVAAMLVLSLTLLGVGA